MVSDTPNFSRQQEREGKVRLLIKLIQGTSALPGQHKEWAFNTLLLLYYSQVLELSAIVVGLVLGVAIVVDAVSDPIVGSLSDNFKSRLGRRHPFILFSIIPTTLSMFALFSPPETLSTLGLTAWLFTWTIAIRICFSFYGVPWGAIGAELSQDYEERTMIIAFRLGMGVYIGSLVIFFVFYPAFPGSAEYPNGLLNRDHYANFALVISSLMFFWMLLSSLGTLREIKYLPQPTDKIPRITTSDTLLRIIEALKNFNFRKLFFGTLLASAIMGTGAVFDTYMNVFFWEFPTEDMKWFSIAAMVGVTISLITIKPLQTRFEKRDIFITCLLMGSILQTAKVAARFFEILPENGDPLLLQIFIIHGSLGSFFAFTFFIVFGSMMADIADEQEDAKDLRQEGVFSGGITFSNKSTTAFGTIIGGFLLESVIQMPVGAVAGEIEYATLVRMAVIDGIIMPTLMVVPVLLVWKYSLSRDAVNSIQTELREKRTDFRSHPSTSSPDYRRR